MDPFVLGTFIVGTIFVVLALYAIYAGIRRMQGHRTRFDSFFESFVQAQNRGVYPPSLRSDPEPAIEEHREISRGDAAARSTPGRGVGSGQDDA